MGKGPARFATTARYKRARVGVLHLHHADVNTPVYMPVGTQGTLKGLTTKQVQALGPEIMLSNTYFLNQRPGIDVLNRVGGLHSLMKWPNNFLTDSGGFQMVSLLKLSEMSENGVTFTSPVTGHTQLLTPELSVQTQQAINTDIIMALDDVVSSLLTDKQRIAEASLRTTRWLDRCIKAHTTANQTLFAICQGHLDISPGGTRDQCINDIIERKNCFGGIAIGGLSGGEAKDDFWKVVKYCCERLPDELPRYCMGVGWPVDIIVCSCLGVDMFDCVYATRTGRFGRALTRNGEVDLTKKLAFTGVIDDACTCECCASGVTAHRLHLLLREGESVAGQLISAHNVNFLLTLMKGFRKSVATQNLDSFVSEFLRGWYRGDVDAVERWVADALDSVDVQWRWR